MAIGWKRLQGAVDVGLATRIFGGLIGAGLCAMAMPVAASDDAPIRYVVRKGDNLITLGDRYFQNPLSYKIVQKRNAIANPNAIAVGSILSIPRNLLKFKPARAKLVSVRGQVMTGASSGTVAQALEGQNLAEGALLLTSASSFATLLLDDGSRVSLPSNSDVRIRRLRSYDLGGSLDYDFDIAKGGLRSTVVKHKSSDDRYQVRTPKAVSAVRGTDFQSRYDPDAGSDFAEVVEGGLAVNSGRSAVKPLPAGNGLAVKANGGVITETLLSPPALRDPEKTQSGKTVRFEALNAGGIRYTIATDPGFSEQVADMIAPTGVAEFADLGNGNYFVRARAISKNNIQGMPATFSFKRLIRGVSASAGKAGKGYVFRWLSEGDGTQRYHFQLFRNATDVVAVVDEAGLSADRITLSDLPPGDYFWRVAMVQYLDNDVAIDWTPLEKLSVSAN
jgi:hypothetical protein